MKYKINYNMYNSVFAVPKAVVENHIKMCSGVALKVLMIILSSGENIPSPENISNMIGYSIEDTKDGITFWINEGILESLDEEASSECTVKSFVQGEISAPAAISTSENKIVPSAQKVGQRKTLDRGEVLEYIEKNGELIMITQEFQRLSGKTLTSSDMECIVAMYTYYGLSADYILMAAHYCYSCGKCSMRYVERTVTSWLDVGVDTHEKLDLHIKKLTEQNDVENLVKSAFGINNRQLVQSEKKMIDKWFNNYRFDITMVKLAYERTIERTGKLAFPYLDKILSNWHSQNIKTPKEAVEEDFQYRNMSKEKEKEFNNCGGSKTSYSHDELDEIINSGFDDVF